ncbi:MAG: HAD family hydrolase [Spirochaetaceae bacterium]|nr:HAD family hydrolase [Spirochaetaceae bacterium]
MKKQRKKILFFDFDGVLCDSANETGRCAWLAGSVVWEEWRETDVPKKYLEKFRKLRPLIETGYQSIALMKLITENYTETFMKTEFHFMKEQVFTSIALNKKVLNNLFNKVREDWIRVNPKNWLAWHKLYPFSKNLISIGKSNYKEVYIVSTKHKIFIEKLLDFFGIDFNPDNIYGLESGENKIEIIENILKENKISPKNSVFVEDYSDTLRAFAANDFLKEMHLYLASWGYMFPEIIEEIEEKNLPLRILYSSMAEDILIKESM